MTSTLTSPLELHQKLNDFLVLSSQQMGWNGIAIEQDQASLTLCEVEFSALSDHLLRLSGHSVRLTHKQGDRLHEAVVQPDDSSFISAGQPSYCRCECGDASRPVLHIYLKPDSIEQVAEASEIDRHRINLTNFSKSDLQLQQVAKLFLAELKSGGMMDRLYVESLTQLLVIHLLRHYSTLTQTFPSESRSLTQNQLQQAIDYIHAHLERDLSLVELAKVINISPTYFASLFKGAMGISPHQYITSGCYEVL